MAVPVLKLLPADNSSVQPILEEVKTNPYLESVSWDYDVVEDKETKPIKNLDDIKRMHEYFLDRGKYRDDAMFMIGINVGVRISDLIRLKWSSFYSNDWSMKHDCEMIEMKTLRTKGQKQNTINMNQFLKHYGHFSSEMQARIMLSSVNQAQEIFRENHRVKVKPRKFRANNQVYQSLELLRGSLKECPNIDDYIFKGSNAGGGSREYLSRQSAWKVFDKATKELDLGFRLGTNGMRKTFGYQMMQKNGRTHEALTTLQKLFRHSSPVITLGYIGITDEDIIKAYEDVGDVYQSVIEYPDILSIEGS